MDDILKYDSNNVFGSISLFSQQCKSSYEKTMCTSLGVPVKNILVVGMGGSTLGAFILTSMNIFKVPIFIVNDYTIPSWVSSETLVFAISYSGGTEETLSSTKFALEKKATVVGITTGGALKELLDANKMQVYIIDKSQNPCNQPRFGVGFMTMMMLKVSTTNSLVTISEAEISRALESVSVWQKNFEENKDIEKIYEITKSFKGAIPVLVLAEHLSNVGQFLRNQIHETAKTLALDHEIPELNHHLMEGLAFPEENKKLLRFIFIESNLYSDKIKKRFEVTKDVLTKQSITYTSVQVEGDTPFSQILITLLRGMYFAFCLSRVNEKDPSLTPWVDYFKEQLK